MTLYVLDTDHVTLYQRGHPIVLERIDATSQRHLAVTLVSAEEQLRGWLKTIRRAASGPSLINAYESLGNALAYFGSIRLLDFDHAANARYDDLRHQKIRIGTRDLRIASIVLSVNGVLLTRNYRDFSRIPQLALEDWSRR